MRNRITPSPSIGTLLCLKVARRCVAAVTFSGLRIIDVRTRALGATASDATTSAAGFAGQVVEDSRPDRLVLELASGPGLRRSVLLEAVLERLAEFPSVPLNRVDRTALLETFTTRLSPRAELMRRSVAAIWPQLTSYSAVREVLDAASLGLYSWTAQALAPSQGERREEEHVAA